MSSEEFKPGSFRESAEFKQPRSLDDAIAEGRNTVQKKEMSRRYPKTTGEDLRKANELRDRLLGEQKDD